MLGTYYLLNLLLVVIMENYIEQEEIYACDDIEQQIYQIKKLEAAPETERYKKYKEDIYKILKLTGETIFTLEYAENDGLCYHKSHAHAEEDRLELIQTKTLPTSNFFEIMRSESSFQDGADFEPTEEKKDETIVYLKPQE
jgi:hypothetical protein